MMWNDYVSKNYLYNKFQSSLSKFTAKIENWFDWNKIQFCVKNWIQEIKMILM